MMQRKIILVSLLLASCGVPHLTPYKMDIRQGNYVSPEMREKLKLGMSKQQVRYLMGTPLVSDDFHGNRWDYPYSLAVDGKLVEKQSMTLYFEGDNLVRVDDASMPALPPAPLEESVVVADADIAPASAVEATSSVDAASGVAAAAVATPVIAPVLAITSSEDSAKIAVQTWADAWAARDLKTYLAAYAPSYKPAGMSHAAWVKQRQQRIAKAKQIKVDISDVTVKVVDEGHATVNFKQDYSSDAYHDISNKTLTLEKSGDVWLIISESSH